MLDVQALTTSNVFPPSLLRPAPLHHHQHQRQNAKSAAPVADSTRESLGKEINNASQVIGANPGATAPEKDCAPTPI